MAKNVLFMLLTVGILLSVCFGCGLESQDKEDSKKKVTTTQSTESSSTKPKKPTEPTAEPTEPTEPVTDPTTEPTEPIRDEELVMLEELFRFKRGNWYNLALTCYYTIPSELDVYKFFYNGFPDIPSNYATAEERELLKDMPNFDLLEYCEITQLPAERMDAVLKEYFGIPLSAFDMTGNPLYYVESTDCYYIFHNDANGCIDLTFHSMEKPSNGTIIIHYTAAGKGGILTLLPVENGYMILSNIPA